MSLKLHEDLYVVTYLVDKRVIAMMDTFDSIEEAREYVENELDDGQYFISELRPVSIGTTRSVKWQDIKSR